MTLSKASVLNAWIRQLNVLRPGGKEVRTNLLTLEGDSTLLRTLRIERLVENLLLVCWSVRHLRYW